MSRHYAFKKYSSVRLMSVTAIYYDDKIRATNRVTNKICKNANEQNGCKMDKSLNVTTLN